MSAYLTGGTALNIPSTEGTGDWHIGGTLLYPERFRVAGKDYVSTNTIFGSEGIFDCTEVLKERGVRVPEGVTVYAANHYRAVGDVIVNALKKGWSWKDSVFADDWFPGDKEKIQLRDFLVKAMPKLLPVEREEITSWMRREKLI